ncbi:hypothetical protein FRX31_033183 [Thalictrum thalictroides]|uniref:Uncharacterized protein n=1 Tax=Thalictrum thalictroides TaxID=46969 RepID=A0A7J6UYG4_THATH|nr:hypothetical protein FRX31_033183 [Thalictrum thalictroides]
MIYFLNCISDWDSLCACIARDMVPCETQESRNSCLAAALSLAFHCTLCTYIRFKCAVTIVTTYNSIPGIEIIDA